MAGEYADRAVEAASDTAASVQTQVKHLLDRQVDSGAEVVGHLARSVHRAAEELDRDAPQLAGLFRSVADRIDRHASDWQGQTTDQLLSSASDFTRRRPALVIGVAAAAGFLAMRTLKSAPSHDQPRRRLARGGEHASRRGPDGA